MKDKRIPCERCFLIGLKLRRLLDRIESEIVRDDVSAAGLKVMQVGFKRLNFDSLLVGDKKNEKRKALSDFEHLLMHSTLDFEERMRLVLLIVALRKLCQLDEVPFTKLRGSERCVDEA